MTNRTATSRTAARRVAAAALLTGLGLTGIACGQGLSADGQQPGATEPGATEPGTAQPGTAEPDAPTSDAGAGTMLATAFPIASVLRATEVSLPGDVAIGEIPPDVRWTPGNRLDIPIVRAGEQAVLVVTVLPDQEACDAASALLTEQESAAVSEQVCAVWVADGRLPVVVPEPGTTPTLDPSDAAR